MQNSPLKRLFAASALALGLAFAATGFGQVVTTSSINGFVTDAQNKAVAGAAVTAVHTPTNTTFQAVTSSAGRFSFTSVPIGGPYTISVTADNITIPPLTDVFTALGESTDVLLVASGGARPEQEVVQLEEFNVYASVSDLDSNTAGAATILNNRRIAAQPSANRAFADLARTNPFVSIRGYPQVQALGMNNRFNTITLDGAKINDSFGLNSSGLFSLNNPFSLDAVEQFSVSLTPYDVRQSGFAGAAINAVSKSGTNEFHGSAYGGYTDQDWQGKDVSGTTIGTRPLLEEKTYGFTFGGPIIKDRLFFFTNYEKFTRDLAGATRPSYIPDASFLAAVDARLAQFPGAPDMGDFGASSISRLTDTKRLAKLDWNISRDHRLSVRYSDTIGSLPNFGSFTAATFSQPLTSSSIPNNGFNNGTTSLSSNFYTLGVEEHVWAGQLFNNWSPFLKTQFSYTSTKQDSVRSTPVIYPEIRIINVPGISSAGATIPDAGGVYSDAFRFGTETSSMGNELHIKTETAAGSADYTWNEFTFSAGADHEASEYFNLFRQGSYGIFSYPNLAAFQADTPSGFERAVIATGLPLADISKFEQTGVFAQVKWQPNARFNATLGMRVDFLGSPIAPPENAAFKAAFGMTNAGTVDGTTTPAPRVSFNYALDRERMTQIRGGGGIFLGRNPWVWISNSYGNFGVSRFTTLVTGATTPTLTQYLNGTYSNTDPAYKFDPASPIGVTNLTASSSTVQTINLIRPGLKPPTILRGNLAIDRRLPFMDATVSLEYIETRQLDALFVDNMNLRPTTIGADGRQRFAGSSGSAPLIPGFGNVIRTRDVHRGKSQYVAVSLDRPFKDGWAYTLSYTRGHATEAQTLNSSTANSQWQFNAVFNQNQVEVARSDYEVKDRVQASVSYELRLKRDFVTTISLYYEGRTGQPYSYVYSGDLNGDGFSANDLIAVPSGTSDARFDFTGMTQPQQDAYFAFINSSEMAKYAGGFAPRNAASTPWQNRLDLRVAQQIPTYGNVKVELFADFINFGNWLSKGLFNYIEEINTSLTNGGLTRAFGNASYTSSGLIRPTVSLDANNQIIFPSASTILPNNSDSRWKIQAGVRVLF